MSTKGKDDRTTDKSRKQKAYKKDQKKRTNKKQRQAGKEATRR